MHVRGWKCVCVRVCESVRVGHCLVQGPALLTGRIPLLPPPPSPVALGLPCLSCNGNGNARPVIAIHPPLRSRVDRVVHPMPSLDRQQANAAILDFLGRLLLRLPLLHMCMLLLLLLLLLPLIRHPPLQGQRTHTSCRMRRSERTGRDTRWAKESVEYEKARNSQSDQQRLTSLDPRPKPLITFPSICSGNGDSGPDAGPTTRGLVFPMAAQLLFLPFSLSPWLTEIAWIARSRGEGRALVSVLQDAGRRTR